MRSDGPPKYERPPRGSVVDEVAPRIRELLQACPTMPATVIAEHLGCDRSNRVLSDRIAELRPIYVPPGPPGRTTYTAGRLLVPTDHEGTVLVPDVAVERRDHRIDQLAHGGDTSRRSTGMLPPRPAPPVVPGREPPGGSWSCVSLEACQVRDVEPICHQLLPPRPWSNDTDPPVAHGGASMRRQARAHAHHRHECTAGRFSGNRDRLHRCPDRAAIGRRATPHMPAEGGGHATLPRPADIQTLVTVGASVPSQASPP